MTAPAAVGSPNIRRPLTPAELEPLRALGRAMRDLRARSGLTAPQLSRCGLITVRQILRIEQGTRRTRRSTLERLVGVMLLAAPDLGDLDEIVARLVELAGPALAGESAYAEKSADRRLGKVQRVEDRRAMYAHLR